MRINQPPGKREAAAERRVKALELRKARASYRAIGRALGISEAQAFRDVKSALAQIAKVTEVKAGELRTLELEALDMAAVAIISLVRAGDVQAIDRWIKLSESRRKLLGIDAPTEIKNIGNLSDAELVSRAARLFGRDAPTGTDTSGSIGDAGIRGAAGMD